MAKFLKSHALPLFDNGFSITPITTLNATRQDQKTGERVPHPSAGKAPVFSKWAKQKVERVNVVEWTNTWLQKCGVGIRTWHTPAVDIDCLDADASKHMRDFVESNVGFAPARVGRAPKTLLLFRADEPFTKVKSHTWIDEWEQKNAVEILGAGQQFVAYGIHPGTKKPYSWIGIENPLNQHAAMDLENITLHDARLIVDEFDRYAREQGWTLHEKEKPSRGMLASGEEVWEDGDVDEDDWVEADDVKDKWEGSLAELESLMEDLPPAEDYNEWYPVIAALKDAEREPDEFREIALQWSARASNFDEDAFERKWDNGSFTRTGQSAFSVKSLVRKVEDLRMEEDILLRIIPAFEKADNLKEWDLAAARLREAPVFGTIRDHAVEVACEHYKRVTGKKIPMSTKKAALSIDWNQFDAPEWVEPWVFAQTENCFLHKRTLLRVVPHAFNNTLAQHTVHMGVTPEQFVTQMRPVPVVFGAMYYPAMHGKMEGSIWKPVRGIEGEEFFEFNGHTWLNTFKPSTIPDVPETVTKAGKKAAEVVLNYFRTQFDDADEFRHMMDWLAWLINNPTKRLKYALLILGGQGSGKSIIKKFLTYMLGAENVGTVNNQVIHKSFTGWQSGAILKVIEEISVAGHRYDVMNVLKEPISNETLFIERKNREGVEEVNTASWMMYTNDIAALPINQGDRRFLIVRSRFRSKQDVEEFSRDNPEFFRDFEKAFTKYAGQIRLWFRDWVYSEEFDYGGHAPVTESTEDMMDSAQDGFTDAIMTAVESNDCSGITQEVIHAVGVARHIDKSVMPGRRHIASDLARIGYFKLGKKRQQVRLQGELGTVYARNPKKWQTGKDVFDLVAIAAHLRDHSEQIAIKDVTDAWE